MLLINFEQSVGQKDKMEILLSLLINVETIYCFRAYILLIIKKGTCFNKVGPFFLVKV